MPRELVALDEHGQGPRAGASKCFAVSIPQQPQLRHAERERSVAPGEQGVRDDSWWANTAVSSWAHDGT